MTPPGGDPVTPDDAEPDANDKIAVTLAAHPTNGRMARADVTGNDTDGYTIHTRFSRRRADGASGTGALWQDEGTTIAGKGPALAFDAANQNQTLVLLYRLPGGGIVWRESTDEVKSWGDTVTIAADGKSPRLIIPEVIGLRYIYSISGGAVKGKLYDKRGTERKAEFIALSGTFLGLDVRHTLAAGGVLRIVLIVRQGTAVKTYSSPDGITFTEEM